MIIWSGLGILIPLVLIVGVVLGVISGGAIGHSGLGIGIGVMFATFGNWALCKAIYRKAARVLVDPATGEQVILKQNHSLFFIPAKAWTWIFGLFAIFSVVMGIASDKKDAKDALKPGYAEFKAADKLIDSKGDQAAHGDTAAANEAAAAFSTKMKTMVAAFFTGGSKKNLMTDGEFLTFCHEGEQNITFICHVPSLRSYKDAEAKESLSDLAWSVASDAAAKLDPEHKKSLVVGLRGISSYATVMKGASGSESPNNNDTEGGESVLIPEFAPRK